MNVRQRHANTPVLMFLAVSSVAVILVIQKLVLIVSCDNARSVGDALDTVI